MTLLQVGVFHRAHVFFLFLILCNPAFADAPYQHFLVGNSDDVTTKTSGLFVMQGGGTDVDENYKRMGLRSGGGDFVVIRARGGDAYNQYIFDLCSCDSVETFVIPGRDAANDPFVINRIRNAEALWIAGGDQSNYVRFWKGTPVEEAIHFVASKPAPIGGTSAGMAVLGEFVYSAMSEESLKSSVALQNPYHTDVTLERDFLHLKKLDGILTDQHLKERDRIGRTVTLLARIMQDGWAPQGKAIAADRETAVHLNPEDGSVEVFATSDHPTPYAYFLRASTPPDVCESNKPLTFHDVAVYRISPGGTFHLDTWEGEKGISYTFSVEKGVLKSSRGEVY